MNKRVHDLTGQVFGRLTVIERAGSNSIGNAQWKCRCRCGKECVKKGVSLGRTRSCGCLRRDVTSRRVLTHGETKGGQSPEYRAWSHMLTRCRNPNTNQFKYYGARGISVCERWLSFEAFVEDMGRKPSPRYSIDRVNNELGYFRENCRWATPVEQARNRSVSRTLTYNGETFSLFEWAKRIGVPYKRLWRRINDGWTIDRALSAP